MKKYTAEYHKPGPVSETNRIILRSFYAASDDEAIEMSKVHARADGVDYDQNNCKLWCGDVLIAD